MDNLIDEELSKCSDEQKMLFSVLLIKSRAVARHELEEGADYENTDDNVREYAAGITMIIWNIIRNKPLSLAEKILTGAFENKGIGGCRRWMRLSIYEVMSPGEYIKKISNLRYYERKKWSLEVLLKKSTHEQIVKAFERMLILAKVDNYNKAKSYVCDLIRFLIERTKSEELTDKLRWLAKETIFDELFMSFMCISTFDVFAKDDEIMNTRIKRIEEEKEKLGLKDKTIH